ncbi:MAG: xylulokinase [Opitutaceae bacterium]
MAYTIGVDSGTQSTKAILWDRETGNVIAEAQAPHDMIAGLAPGHLEQDPAGWVRALESVLTAILTGIDRSKVVAIGVSGQQHGFVPLDGEGRVIRPAKLWCDTSTTAECDQLHAALGGESAAIAATGNRILPGFTAPKILWMKNREPANFARLRHVLLPHDYLNFHLTGSYFMEYGDASGTAMMDVRQRTWSRAVVDAIDPNLIDWLPGLSDSKNPAGRLRPALAEKLGLSPDVVVSAGGGDNMMGAIGTGNVTRGVVTASFGTSGTIYAYNENPVVDPRGEIAAFCDSTGGYLPLLCTMNVTSVTEAVRRLFGFDHEALARAVSETPAGAGGLVLLPYLEGERTPSVPDGSGVLLGLSGGTFKPGHLARAAMEGVTLGMNFGLRRLGELGIEASEVRLTGGGARSPVWRQIMADIFGIPVVAMKTDEGAALGAALQAAWCFDWESGRSTSLSHLVEGVVEFDESTRCQPDRERHRLYGELQGIQDDLSHALRDIFARHRKLISGN